MIFEEVPRPAGPGSHALVANGIAFVADPGEVPNTFAHQVRQTLTNVRAILGGVGSNLRAAICRSEVAYRDGKVVGERGSGRLLPREAGTAYAGPPLRQVLTLS
jgi:enamine deaminase RidA (YjgF/YER057c/UK114 family)